VRISSTSTAAIDRRVKVIDGANEQGAIRRISELRALPFVVLLALQLHLSFEMGATRLGLMGSAPE
jgi:hypothetical protein